jgi:hypothetical protein
MIVRDCGDNWQIVLQTDHAALAGQFARAWGRPEHVTPPVPLEPVAIAAERHDDGWAVWERAPSLDGDGARPRNFLDVQVLSHLAFYRAAIASVLDHDRYAGMLVSMHGAGIYRGRYGTQPSLKLTFADDVRREVDDFVHEQERLHSRLASELAIPDDERWTNYRLLQVYDRLSLYFCLSDTGAGEAAEIDPLPLDYAGVTARLAIDPLAAWRVRVDPYPFAESPATFTLRRRLVPKRAWPDGESFRREFFQRAPEPVEITVEQSSEGAQR